MVTLACKFYTYLKQLLFRLSHLLINLHVLHVRSLGVLCVPQGIAINILFNLGYLQQVLANVFI